jgi:hypothetical protein
MDIHRPQVNPRRHLRVVDAPAPRPEPLQNSFRDRQMPLHSASHKALAIIIVLLTAAVFMYPAGKLFLAAWITRGKTMDPSVYERAVKYDPTNAEYHFLLAQIYNYSTQHLDLDRARIEYEFAVQYNPDRSQYWLELSKFYEQTGNIERCRYAMAKALENDPNFALRHWAAANLYVRLGDQQAADRELRRAAELDVNYTVQVLDLVWTVYGDPELVLSTHVPNTREANLTALNYFSDHDSARGAELAWQRLKSFEVARRDRLHYIEYLLRNRRPHDGWTVFAADISEASPFYNGDFESDPLNGGFDWRYSSSDDIEVHRDHSTAKEGLTSLLIQFSGTQNPDFRDVWHYLAVEQNRAYTLQFWMKTEGLTTDEGIYVHVDGATSEKQIGTTYWRQFSIPFTATSDLVRVTVQRDASRKFDNRIKGKVWLDGFTVAAIP